VRFSDRIGATEPRRVLQTDVVDDPLLNTLWNFVGACLDARARSGQGSNWEAIVSRAATAFFKVPIDDVPLYQDDVARKWLRVQYNRLQWYDVYNFIEFLVDELGAMTSFPLSRQEVEGFITTFSRTASRRTVSSLANWCRSRTKRRFRELSKLSGLHKQQASTASGSTSRRLLDILGGDQTLTIEIPSRNPLVRSSQQLAKSPVPARRVEGCA
jgi:hypothetical protein